MVVWGGAGVPVTKGDCGKVWSCRWGLDLLDAPRTSQNGVIKIHPRACRTSILSELDMHFYSILLFFLFYFTFVHVKGCGRQSKEHDFNNFSQRASNYHDTGLECLKTN